MFPLIVFVACFGSLFYGHVSGYPANGRSCLWLLIFKCSIANKSARILKVIQFYRELKNEDLWTSTATKVWEGIDSAAEISCLFTSLSFLSSRSIYKVLFRVRVVSNLEISAHVIQWISFFFSPSRLDYALYFRNKGVSEYSNIWGMPSLTEFTVCLWMKSTAQPGSPFSYAVPAHDNELLLYYDPNFSLWVGNAKR